MSRKSPRKPAQVAQTMEQFHHMARNIHCNEHLTKEEQAFVYEIYRRSFDIRRRLREAHPEIEK